MMDCLLPRIKMSVNDFFKNGIFLMKYHQTMANSFCLSPSSDAWRVQPLSPVL